jgi:hypothetical protein
VSEGEGEKEKGKERDKENKSVGDYISKLPRKICMSLVSAVLYSM